MNESPSLNPTHSPIGETPLIGASAQPHLREITPTRREIPVTAALSDQGTILLQVPRDAVGLNDRPITLGCLDFKPKEETHITVVGFKFSKEMKKALHDPEKAQELMVLLEEVNRSPGLRITLDSASPILHLARDVSIDRKGGGKEMQHQESLIVPVACPAIDSFVKEIGRILGTDIPTPYLHVTLYTHRADQGIGVPTESVLDTLKVGEISAPEFEQLRRSTNANTAERPLTALDCGRELVCALAGSAPVKDFEKLLARPEFAAFLGEIAALKGVLQDPRHHPEGSVYIHTMRVVEETAAMCDALKLVRRDRETALLGALLHDIGKGVPGITAIEHEPNGAVRITAHGHERAGLQPAQRLLTELGLTEYQRGVLAVVEHHMSIPSRFREVEKGNMPIARCIERTRSFIDTKLDGVNPEILLACMVADWRGRGLPDSAAKRAEFIRGFTEVFHRAIGA